MYRFGQKRRYLRGRSDAGTRHSSKQKLYGDDSCPSQPLSEGERGPVAGVLDRGNKLGKSSTHVVSCITSVIIVCEDKE